MSITRFRLPIRSSSPKNLKSLYFDAAAAEVCGRSTDAMGSTGEPIGKLGTEVARLSLTSSSISLFRSSHLQSR